MPITDEDIRKIIQEDQYISNCITTFFSQGNQTPRLRSFIVGGLVNVLLDRFPELVHRSNSVTNALALVMSQGTNENFLPMLHTLLNFILVQ